MTFSTRRETPKHLPYISVAIGVATVSTASVLIRLAQTEMPSLSIASWRMALAASILAPISLATRYPELRTLRSRDWCSMLAAGLLLAVHFASWITSLAYTSVAASVVLVTTNPIFIAVVSRLLLHEKLRSEMALALIVVTIGSCIIGLGDWGAGTHRVVGDLLALLGAMAAAGYFLIGRQLRARLSLLAYVFPVYSTAALALLAAVGLGGAGVAPESPKVWLWLLLLAIGPQILGHSSLNWALRYLSATFVTIAVLGEAVGATLLAWWLLEEAPSAWSLVGGALVLSGIALASHAERPAGQP